MTTYSICSDKLNSCLGGDSQKKTRGDGFESENAAMFNMWPDDIMYAELHSYCVLISVVMGDMCHHVELVCDFSSEDKNTDLRFF